MMTSSSGETLIMYWDCLPFSGAGKNELEEKSLLKVFIKELLNIGSMELSFQLLYTSLNRKVTILFQDLEIQFINKNMIDSET